MKGRWDGIRRKSTIVQSDKTKAHYAEGVSLRVDGELRRRPGFAQANFGPLGAAVYGLVPANPSGGTFIIGQRPDGTFEGFGSPLAQWGNMQLIAPTGSRGYSSGVGDDSLGPYNGVFNASGGNPQNFGGGASGPISGGANPGHTFEITSVINLTLVATVGNRTLTAIDMGTKAGDTLMSETLPGFFTLNADGSWTNVDGGVGPGVVNIAGTVVHRCSGLVTNEIIQACSWQFSVASVTGTWDTTIVDLNAGPDGPVTYQPVIYRSDNWTTSFDLYAANGVWPIEPGGARFVENVPITPGAPFATASLWTPNGAVPSDWRFIAVARRGSLVGPFGRLTN